MCLLIDRREPKEIDGLISRQGVDVMRTELTWGDYAFTGHGEFGECMIGIERKRLSDAVNSMKDRRLAGAQLRGLWETYEYAYLFCEWVWRPGRGGQIETLAYNHKTRKREFMSVYGDVDRHAVSYRQVDSYLNSLSLRSRSPIGEPLRVKRTNYIEDTAVEIVDLYRGFTEKKWHEHHAHDQLYAPAPVPTKGHGTNWGTPHEHNADNDWLANTLGRQQRAGFVQEKPTTLWRMAAQLPGVDNKALNIAKHFGTVFDAVLAGLDPELKDTIRQILENDPKPVVKEWMRVACGLDEETGRKRPGIGRITAEAAIRSLMEKGA